VFENRTFRQCELHDESGHVIDNKMPPDMTNRTTDNYDQINTPITTSIHNGCNKQCNALMEVSNAYEECSIVPYEDSIAQTSDIGDADFNSVTGNSYSNSKYGHKSQSNVAPTVPGKGNNLHVVECDTYDHTDGLEKVRPFNEYNYLRNVEKYTGDSLSNTYDQLGHPISRDTIVFDYEVETSTYDVT
jgi:hypothetical protein